MADSRRIIEKIGYGLRVVRGGISVLSALVPLVRLANRDTQIIQILRLELKRNGCPQQRRLALNTIVVSFIHCWRVFFSIPRLAGRSGQEFLEELENIRDTIAVNVHTSSEHDYLSQGETRRAIQEIIVNNLFYRIFGRNLTPGQARTFSRYRDCRLFVRHFLIYCLDTDSAHQSNTQEAVCKALVNFEEDLRQSIRKNKEASGVIADRKTKPAFSSRLASALNPNQTMAGFYDRRRTLTESLNYKYAPIWVRDAFEEHFNRLAELAALDSRTLIACEMHLHSCVLTCEIISEVSHSEPTPEIANAFSIALQRLSEIFMQQFGAVKTKVRRFDMLHKIDGGTEWIEAERLFWKKKRKIHISILLIVMGLIVIVGMFNGNFHTKKTVVKPNLKAPNSKKEDKITPASQLDNVTNLHSKTNLSNLVQSTNQLPEAKIREAVRLKSVEGEMAHERARLDGEAEVKRLTEERAKVEATVLEKARLQLAVAEKALLVAKERAKAESATREPQLKTESSLTNQNTKNIATNNIGSLHVVLKSVLPVMLKDRNGLSVTGTRWSFEFINQATREPLVVAMNAESLYRAPQVAGVSFDAYSPTDTPLRSSVLDDNGGVWNLSSSALDGLQFVRTGVHGRNGQDTYNAMEIVRLLELRDLLGRETDDPTDGIYANADSIGEGGQNITFDSSRGNISPRKFFPFNGNRFVSGSVTTIQPGQSVTVTMSFHQEKFGMASGAPPKLFQFDSEIVIGLGAAGGKKTYTLNRLSFYQVKIPISMQMKLLKQ